MTPIITIHRKNGNKDQTLGFCNVQNEMFVPLFSSISLERGKRFNAQNISCIPKGQYKVVLEYSDKFKCMLWEIKDVPNRSECKFHAANYFSELNGCIALGIKPSDINNDGQIDITQSKTTMNSFHEALRPYKEALLIITEESYLQDYA